MMDKYQREIINLRISLTQRCNLQCPYCHKEGESQADREMTFDEIEERIIAARDAGMKKVKITGGEPLMRQDIVEIVEMMKNNGLDEISMTTNGILLEGYARQLKQAGLDRLNIGCDSLSSLSFLKNASQIKNGLDSAKKAGFSHIKLNMVVLKGLNDHEIDNMINFARDNNCILQLIELINLNNEFYRDYYLSLEDIENKLKLRSSKVSDREMQNRKQYEIDGTIVEVVRPPSRHFCSKCNKLRITSDGMIKPCLMNKKSYDFNPERPFYNAMKERVMFYGKDD